MEVIGHQDIGVDGAIMRRRRFGEPGLQPAVVVLAKGGSRPGKRRSADGCCLAGSRAAADGVENNGRDAPFDTPIAAGKIRSDHKISAEC